ncbi:oxidoreductase [Aureimonas sp. SA4125]|uniref:NAD(P)/FAD-dependent oxidoreductase n=1 Tax=Aureimonas sp. SA4125 TaxID=2826993 RepID=UPI001CC3E782|nr:FAD-dependent oxidoreductase [Aureimonas sp. SA4125]BDA85980.1 oxidoreductase [Aureimonas sp. SA4125]
MNVIIAGGGQAGFQVASSLRQGGYRGGIVLVAEENRVPYQRPPLSKAYLKEDMGFDRLELRPESFYAAQSIELRLGETVARIDRGAGTVVLGSGESLAFDHLVLATGARNRVLPIPGADLAGVHLLRSAEDAEGLRGALRTARRMVIVGGGFIGLEVAASARAKGVAVTVLEAADRLMGRVVSPAISAFFLAAHRDMGTDVHFGAKVVGIRGDGRVAAVATETGTHEADLVLMAAGVIPNDELAASAGLPTASGVIVDATMTTEDPRIFAIGDCAVFESRHAAGRVRLESVQNAVDQAKCVAARILGGTIPYDSLPWFWSDQGPYKLQIVGITSGADHVHVVHVPGEDRLIAYCFAAERLLGIETVNRPGDHMAGRRLLSSELRLSRAEIEHGDFDLRAHIAALTRA